MIKRLFLIGLIALTPISLLAKKEALIVAVGQYKNNSQKKLHVGHDISKMEYLLNTKGFHVTILRDSQATYYNVVNHLKYYQTLSSHDTFVFYNTSHGVQIEDFNDDEKDNLDEAFVLYDATFNNSSISTVKGILIDDELDFLLSKISAKKLMIIDACHSGTPHKGLSVGYTTKGVSRSTRFKNSKRDLFTKKQNHNVKNLVVLSASKDNELSIDTPDKGGLFTDTLYHVWNDNPRINFKELANKTSKIISKKRYDNLKPQQPQVYSTNNEEYMETSLYLQDIEGYMDMVVQKSKKNPIGLYSKYSKYRVGDNISFKINPQNKKGYLYLLNIGEKKVKKLFPNPYQKSSKISSKICYIPSKNFEIKAHISNGKKEQRTVAYAILSDKPIRLLENSQELSFKTLEKIFGNPNKKSWWKDMFSSKISVAKSTFTVVR